jgi:hypothetical protein
MLCATRDWRDWRDWIAAKNRATTLPLAGCFEMFHEVFRMLKRRNTQLHAHHPPPLVSLRRFVSWRHGLLGRTASRGPRLCLPPNLGLV